MYGRRELQNIRTRKFDGFVLLIINEARLLYTWVHLLLLLAALGGAGLLSQHDQLQIWESFYAILEPLFPVLAIPCFVPLILKEQHKRTLILIGPTQTSLRTLFSIRVVLSLIFFLGLIVCLTIGIQFAPPFTAIRAQVRSTSLFVGPNGIIAVLYTLGAPVLFLCGIGTVSAHLTCDARVGYLTAFAFWMFNRLAFNMSG